MAKTKLAFYTAFILLIQVACQLSKKTNSTNPATVENKETYLPVDAWQVAKDNDYNDSTSRFNFYRMKETENLVAFWESGFGKAPSNTSDPKFRFDLDDLIAESEKMFQFFRDSLKFVEQGHSLTDKYRMNFYVFYNEDGTVYGGGADDSIGVMWLSPGRIQDKPYGAMAHEMGHAFQYMVSADGHWGFTSSPEGSKGQSIFEMTSQYMLWHYYPDWMRFENYHLKIFMHNTHKAFLHEDNMYCSPYVLEYWSEKHGIDFIAKLWRKAKEGEDAIMTYKRITGIDQSAFNDEMLDAYLHFMTWDMNRIRKVASNFANQHTTKMEIDGDGWYKISADKCPQNYGYNGIQLEVPAGGTEIKLDFKGIAGAEGYHAVNTDRAGWRYGFVAEKSNGERIYSDTSSQNNGQAKFTVPENTQWLWLVVVGAPTQHWEHIFDGDPDNDEQWPYEIKLDGTKPIQSVVN
ncbi:DUF6055 domain-containing protein [Mangrovibacterium lignilyticum]|uniref:DUF6055 domain-containing protein n=1 Tax=Mangrovibacterium lignilyticum TaxID=2668052 RepID=UPI0013D86902|nr:DUF6055 domain-containing protein [Mangrovibacterium lignilyticum]